MFISPSSDQDSLIPISSKLIEELGEDEGERIYLHIKEGTTSRLDEETLKKVQDLALDYIVDRFLQASQSHDLENGQDAYVRLLDAVSSKHLLSDKQKESASFLWYNLRYRNLVESGIKEEVAEGMIAIEMCNDPYIPETHKERMRPIATSTGLSGSYFIKDRAGNKIAVFKPKMQEVGMPDNPKGDAYRGAYNPEAPHRTQRRGHVQGTSWLCEVMAFELGKDLDVPYTTRLSLAMPSQGRLAADHWGRDKVIIQEGSYQLFVEGTSFTEISDKEYSEIPQAEVQKVLVLDILFGNADRHRGNSLYDARNQRLIPIDHGLCFGDAILLEPFCESETYSHMLHSSRAKRPLELRLQQWILNYDIDEACEKMKKYGFSYEAIAEHTMRALLLKQGVIKGLSIYEMGKLSMVDRRTEVGQTGIAHFFQYARNRLQSQYSEGEKRNFFSYFQQILEDHV